MKDTHNRLATCSDVLFKCDIILNLCKAKVNLNGVKESVAKRENLQERYGICEYDNRRLDHVALENSKSVYLVDVIFQA